MKAPAFSLIRAQTITAIPPLLVVVLSSASLPAAPLNQTNDPARQWDITCDNHGGSGCNNVIEQQLKTLGLSPFDLHLHHLNNCAEGRAKSCTVLGYIYQQGIGITPSPALAAQTYRKACDGGDPQGCTYLGRNYMRGDGVDIDMAQSVHYFRQACEADDMTACATLGAIYHGGAGIEPAPETSLQYLRKACDLGQSTACKLVDAAPNDQGSSKD